MTTESMANPINSRITLDNLVGTPVNVACAQHTETCGWHFSCENVGMFGKLEYVSPGKYFLMDQNNVRFEFTAEEFSHNDGQFRRDGADYSRIQLVSGGRDHFKRILNGIQQRPDHLYIVKERERVVLLTADKKTVAKMIGRYLRSDSDIWVCRNVHISYMKVT